MTDYVTKINRFGYEHQGEIKTVEEVGMYEKKTKETTHRGGGVEPTITESKLRFARIRFTDGTHTEMKKRNLDRLIERAERREDVE